jgi:hypothetical protein
MELEQIGVSVMHAKRVGLLRATYLSMRAHVDVTGARDGVNELRSAWGPRRATEMGFVNSALYPNSQKA